MTKISFICPVFNKEKYLPKVLESIKNQVGDFKKEYIFINDGSTDNSLKLLKEGTKKWKNTTIINQTNKGPAKATQEGIHKSKGDFIKLVGGDDVMSPNCTKTLLETIKKTDSVAVFSKYELVDNYEKLIFNNEKINLYKTLSNPLEKTITSTFSGTTPNLYSKVAIHKSKGCDTRLFVEDFSLVLRLSNQGSFSFINNITSFGPKSDQTRIMLGQKAQLLHDYNAALYYFIKENPSINDRYKKIACKKALGRAEKWYRRTQKKTIFSEINYLRILNYFTNKNELFLLRKSCETFYSKKDDEPKRIRYMIV